MGWLLRPFSCESPQRALRLGLAFHRQLVEEVPNEAFDQRVDAVVYESGVMVCRSARLERLGVSVENGSDGR